MLAGHVPSEQQTLERHYYLEILTGTWLAIAFSIMVFGVLVHINLNFIVGICLIFMGIALLAVTLFSAAFWPGLGLFEVHRFIAIRRIVLLVKFSILVASLAFSVWAAVIMIQRTE